jgi:hypothetical protein
MYSIHYHIKMHESSLHSTSTDLGTKDEHRVIVNLRKWLKKKKA